MHYIMIHMVVKKLLSQLYVKTFFLETMRPIRQIFMKYLEETLLWYCMHSSNMCSGKIINKHLYVCTSIDTHETHIHV